MKTLREYIDKIDEISRRDFLKGAGAAAAGAGLAMVNPTKAQAGIFGSSIDKKYLDPKLGYLIGFVHPSFLYPGDKEEFEMLVKKVEKSLSGTNHFDAYSKQMWAGSNAAERERKAEAARLGLPSFDSVPLFKQKSIFPFVIQRNKAALVAIKKILDTNID